MKIKIVILLAVVCLIAYFNSLQGRFVSDDMEAIVNNPNLGVITWTDPLTIVYSAISHGGIKPAGYHVASLTLHIINTVLVFFILRLFFGDISSAAGALIFAVHPVHTEAVSWISGMHYLVNGLCVFSIILLYARNKIKSYLFSLFLYGYMMISYYHWLFMVPLILLAFELIRRRSLAKIAPYFIISAMALSRVVLTIQKQIALVATSNPGADFQKYWYINIPHSICANLWLVFFPFKLVFYHNPDSLTLIQVISEFVFAAGLLALILLLAIRKRGYPLLFALSIFLITLIPTYSPRPVCWVVAERYLYVPSILLSFVIAYFYSVCCQDRSQERRLETAA